jgi:hypothetical protein
MNHAAKLAREDALTEALRATDAAIGDEQPTDQALRIIEALKRLRSDGKARVPGLDRRDYLAEVQDAARLAWSMQHGGKPAALPTGPGHDAVAGIDTPLGRLKMVTWRRPWNGNLRGERIAWAGEYYLDDEPITVAEIKAAGLAQRPTTRNRQRKEPTK